MIHEVIKALRIKMGLSQVELADLAGLTQQEISLIEKGKRKRYTEEELINFAKVLGVNPGYFLDADKKELKIPNVQRRRSTSRGGEG